MNKTKMTGACRRVLVVASALSSLLATGGLAAPSASAETVRDGQWYLETMQAERMWEKTTGKGVTVAVVDTGVRASQPELRGRVLPGKSFSFGEEGKDGRGGGEPHGTAMATLIAGDGRSDMQVMGLAPGARILPIKVSTGLGVGSVDPIADAVRYAADSDAKIISMSIGVDAASTDGKSQAKIQRAVDYAIKRGKLLFAAAGNDGSETNIASYPGATRGVVGVTALDSHLKMGKFSTHGPQVALSAPGLDIPTVCDGKTGYCRSKGTSQATAVASGSAALVWSLHPTWTGNQVLRVLLDTAGRPTHGKVPSEYVGYGTIRPRMNVLENKGNPGPPDVNPLVAAAKPSAKEGAPSAPVTHAPALAWGKKSKSKDEDDNLPWIIGGVAAIALPGAVLLALLIRRRNRKARAARARQQQAAGVAGSGSGMGMYGSTTPVEPPYPPQSPPGTRPPGAS
ncbi:S8 family serine peptidase [Streptomyces sp. I05A-00742]|uniref:S8 family serine peptidase n=1 Tax=Streptomyces sp. I05A-00742 TaxID=2732853 RepID=UPI00289926BC|nr:S8 family serine peptidase [Streptomyces sp. I05A-00742]